MVAPLALAPKTMMMPHLMNPLAAAPAAPSLSPPTLLEVVAQEVPSRLVLPLVPNQMLRSMPLALMDETLQQFPVHLGVLRWRPLARPVEASMRLPVKMLLAKSLSDHPAHSLPMMLRLWSKNLCLSWPLQSQPYSMEMYLCLDIRAVVPMVLLGPLRGLEVGPMAL